MERGIIGLGERRVMVEVEGRETRERREGRRERMD